MTNDELEQLFIALFRYITDVKLELNALRSVCHARGVPETDYQAKYVELRQAFDQQVQEVFAHAKSEDTAQRIRRMLEAVEGTKH